MKTVIKIVAGFFVFIGFILSIALAIHLAPPAAALFTLPKMLAVALAPYTILMGLIGLALVLLAERRTLIELLRHAGSARSLGVGTVVITLMGLVAIALPLNYLLRVTEPHDGFDRAFGRHWENQIPGELSARMLAQRWSWQLPDTFEPRVEHDVLVVTIPGVNHSLTANVWLPPPDIISSGLAYLYINMGGWKGLDKQTTVPMFRHVAAQGHIVVDFVSRERPTTDFVGMVGDIKRAIAWLKHDAARFGINPERIVLAGGSAGGHLALLTAYSADDPQLTPTDLVGADTSVRAVVGFYAPADLRLYYEVEGRRAQSFLDQWGDDFYKNVASSEKLGVGETTDKIFTELLGGLPDRVSALYDLASPIRHVTCDSPPTLLFHGEHDSAAPILASQLLYSKLLEVGVPVVYHEIPSGEHAFDYVLPQLSPAAQVAYYDLDRFLALMAVEPTSPRVMR